jgi:hypothetical protein
VHFRDGSVVEIEGIGTVLFACRNGEHRSLTRVYLISMLTMNIISLGQLDEIGYEVMIYRGVMRLWDEQKKLLAKVQRSSNWLDVLDLDIAQPMNMVAKGVDSACLMRSLATLISRRSGCCLKRRWSGEC